MSLRTVRKSGVPGFAACNAFGCAVRISGEAVLTFREKAGVRSMQSFNLRMRCILSL